MLITSRFLIINLPKSGSSFVRAVIKAIYAHRCRHASVSYGRTWIARIVARVQGRAPHCYLRELMLPNTRLPGRPRDQHGTVAQIPHRFRDRAIMSVIRNPYDKMMSGYRFRWWARYPPLDAACLRCHFPTFPDLSFVQFLQLSDRIATRKMGADATDIGNLTVEFIQFFFRDPPGALRRLSDDHVRSGAFRAEMADITFLRQESLAGDLAAFLAGFGFTAEELALCLDHPAVNVTADNGSTGVSEDAIWTREDLDHFEWRERYLFAMLAALGFRYVAPTYGPPQNRHRGDIAAGRS